MSEEDIDKEKKKLLDREDDIVAALESLSSKESIVYCRYVVLIENEEPSAQCVTVKRNRDGFRLKELAGRPMKTLGKDARDAHKTILGLRRFSPFPDSIHKRCGQKVTQKLFCSEYAAGSLPYIKAA